MKDVQRQTKPRKPGQPLEAKVVIIGGGTMGEIMVAAVADSPDISLEGFTVIDRNRRRCAQLEHSYGVAVDTDLIRPVQQADVIIFAVKPQEAKVMLEHIAQFIPADALVVSIMAGVTITVMEHILGHDRIIRAMPNTPARVRQGMTVWKATEQVSEEQKNVARALFDSFGVQIEVEDEDGIDVATAISGSGPGYIFEFVDQFFRAAMKLGLPEEQALVLVQQTLLGSVELMKQSDDDPATLRDAVTSKGGTTEAALTVLHQQKVPQAVEFAVQAAYDRSKELSKELEG